MPVMSGHRPDLAMPPSRLGQHMPNHKIPHSHTSRLGPRSLSAAQPASLFGLPPAPDPVQACQSVGRTSQWTCPPPHDHLEVLERPRRLSADFFHTRISTATSPNVRVNPATSASNCYSRDVGLDLPASIPALSPSRNCRFQFPIAYSETPPSGLPQRSRPHLATRYVTSSPQESSQDDS